ncbi:MAG: hypothetical protein K6T66_04895 [Peptococcaceae bacterium]|nr:hypothetical protein [Peptococcaceae bacterium]
MSEITPQAAGQPSVTEMLEAEEWYDLLPVEKKLIGWSLCLGIVLLVIFILTFVVFK